MHTLTKVGHIPNTYSCPQDDYLVQVRDRRLLENPLPEHFALPPGCDMEHPLFFDYTLP